MMTTSYFKRFLSVSTTIAVLILKSVNVYSQCPIIPPTVSDTCLIGSQSVQLNATGSTNLYAAYDALIGGNFVGNGNPINVGIVSNTTTFYVAAQAQNYALDFDGSNDKVAINGFTYNATGLNELTVEAWVKTTSTNAMIIASFDRSEYWRLGIGSTGASTGMVSWSVNTNSGYLDMGGNTFVNDGQWHHVAGTFNNGVAKIFVDGVEDATATLGTTWGSGNIRYGFIGVGSEAPTFNGSTGPNHYMSGEIDELRVWNVARSATELTSTMHSCLLGSEVGLELYYKLNEGSGTSVSDQAGLSTGTLVNMSAATDWLSNNTSYSCPSCESIRVPLTVTIDNSSTLTITGASPLTACNGNLPTLDAGSGYNAYLWNTGETTQTIQPTISGSYSVTVTNNSGCSVKDSVEVNFEGGEAQTAALFDGANDYAAIDGISYSSTTITELSVEAWVKTSDAGNQIIASFDRSEYWRLGINGDGAGNGQVSWNLRTSSGILDFGSTARVDDGNWHHIVGTYDNGVASIYIDGILDATATQGTTIGTGVLRYGFIGTGSEANSYNGSRGPNNYFDGEIEELRIWSKALTIGEVRAEMCRNYSGASSDLLAYFKFNDGSGVTFSSEVPAVSAQAFSINPASFWVNSGAPIGDNSVFLYTGSWSGTSINITACSGAELTVSNVVSAAEGVHLYLVEGSPLNLTGIDSFQVGNHYYGVFWPQGESATYSAQIDYTSHPLVSASNQQGLVTLTREDKTAASFVEVPANNNVIANTITTNMANRQEIIIDSKYFIWTGSTNTDWATASNWNPSIVPPIGANILVPDVSNQPLLDVNRIVGSLNIDTDASVDANGNMLEFQGNLIANGAVYTTGGALVFSGSGEQFFIAGIEQTIDNLTSTNATNVALTSRKVSLNNTLSVQNGTFSTNDSLVLVSGPFSTARISKLMSGASIVGEIEMQRYIDAGETYWRFFSSAVQGATVEEYQGDFITSGYVGSDFPNFPFTSVYTYTEGSGYAAVSNANQIINQGQGLMVWSGDTITGTDPFVVDYRGEPNQGDINLPVSLTNNDGWNLVGNPYASTIDWDSPDWVKTNMADAVYILNPDTEQYATYINGASANGGSNLIASQQAFWVGAIGSSPVLTAKESVKSSVDQAFFKSNTAISSGMHIILSGNSMTDEAVLRHVEGASDAYDSHYDATKKFASWMQYPHVSLLNESGVDFTVHSFDKGHQQWSVPLRTIVFQEGIYDLVFNDIHELNVPCLKLEDTYTGQMYIVEEGMPLSFNMSDTTYAPRFILHLGKNYLHAISNPSCTGERGKVEIFVDSSETGFFDVIGANYFQTGSFVGSFNIDSLVPGAYEIVINDSSSLCESTAIGVQIDAASPIVVQAIITPENAGGDGAIQTTVVGGTPDYIYHWSTGASTADIFDLNAGTYQLEVMDANGCAFVEVFSVSSALGFDNTEVQTTLKYFPEAGTIQITGALESNYKLVDVSGKTIQEYTVEPGLETAELYISKALPSGTYILTGITKSFKLNI